MKGTTGVYLKLLVEKAKEEGLEPGGTFIQKGMYLLSDALDADLDLHFEAYLYGPYSKEVDGLVDYLKWRGELDKPPVNVEPEVHERVKWVIALFKEAKEKFPQYADFRARLWELLGTTDYVMRYVQFTSNPETEEGLRKIAHAVCRWKKYFNKEEAKEAAKFLYEKLKEFEGKP